VPRCPSSFFFSLETCAGLHSWFTALRAGLALSPFASGATVDAPFPLERRITGFSIAPSLVLSTIYLTLRIPMVGVSSARTLIPDQKRFLFVFSDARKTLIVIYPLQTNTQRRANLSPHPRAVYISQLDNLSSSMTPSPPFCHATYQASELPTHPPMHYNIPATTTPPPKITCIQVVRTL